MKLNKKALIALVSAALLLTFAVSGTVAYLVDVDEPVVNEFKPAKVTVEIPENFTDPSVKKDVYIKNTGDIKAYVRAMYIVTWQNATGMVPADVGDYTITFEEGSKWIKSLSTGFYYWPEPLEAKAPTDDKLIAEIKPVAGAAPGEDYYLNVEIIAQAIQAEPVKAVTEAWGVTLSGTTITAVP